MKCITGNYLTLSFTHHVDREIYYPAALLPQIALPRGLGERVGHGCVEEVSALFEKVGVQPSPERGSKCLSSRGRGGGWGPWAGDASYELPGGGSCPSQALPQLHLESCVEGWGYGLVSVSKEERKLEGEPLREVAVRL